MRPWSFQSAFLLISLSSFVQSAAAQPVACGAGTLDIAATSNLPIAPGPTFNVGQNVRLAAQLSGVTATSFAWTVDGPHLKDYAERIGNVSTGPLAWGTTPLAAADLTQSSLSFYWKPSPTQIHPLNGGPVGRTVTLNVTTAGGPCSISRTYQVERNGTDVNRQAEDYFCANHAASTQTNPRWGLILDDHIEWHLVAGSHILAFLPWHRALVDRFDRWRSEFGYAPIVPWYPGHEFPTGPELANSPRFATFNPDANRIPTWFTIAGGTAIVAGARKLADFATLTAMSDEFEGTWHGDVHCNIGPGPFWPVSSATFGSMCTPTSPIDPLFWRWHKFIDLVYMNVCGVKSLTCPPGLPAATDVWMGDNPADIAAGGTTPSPGPHWLSPDIWNRTASIPCTPPGAGPGVVRDCGSASDHENPIAAQPNFLYATLRNDRPGATMNIYAEVAVYVANAATGLAWPADFEYPPGTPLLDTRQFITLNLGPGETTDIGPLPWTPPNPSPSDHWCLYIRVLTVQDPLTGETADVGVNTRDRNSIAWRNLTIVNAGERMTRSFIVRNVRRDARAIDLEFDVPEALLQAGEVVLEPGPELRRALQRVKWEGAEPTERGIKLVKPKAVAHGVALRAGLAAPMKIHVTTKERELTGDILIVQRSGDTTDGGILIRVQPGNRR